MGHKFDVKMMYLIETEQHANRSFLQPFGLARRTHSATKEESIVNLPWQIFHHPPRDGKQG
jgi:hypothetical protein